jgi:hypothetical protein
LRRTPLEILAGTLYHFKNFDETAKKLIDSYDEFLGMLSDQSVRNHLETLPLDPDQADEVFHRARQLSHTFRDGLQELFFDTDLYKLTKTYGVF